VSDGKIFICYRREETSGHAGRLYDRLNRRFPGRVFMDVTSIGVGTRWHEVIEQTLEECKVAVVLIGRHWLDKNSDGARRIDVDDDPTRAEITAALRLKVKMVPLLVSGAAIPEQKDLPADVAPLVDWQAMRVDDDDFDHDADRLLKALEGHLGERTSESDDKERQTQIRQLMDDAEGAIDRADWISAAQTLRSVISLDGSHRAAAERLAYVQQRSRLDFRPDPQPAPKGRGGWFGFGFGSWQFKVAISAVGTGFIAIVAFNGLTGNSGQLDAPVTPIIEPEPAAAPPNPAAPPPARSAPPEPPRPSESRTASLAGTYVLAALQQNGVPIAATGQMTLLDTGAGRYEFQTSISVPGVGTFVYIGEMQGAGTQWALTTRSSTDPTAVIGAPIPTQINFDGTQLAAQNTFGQAALWIRQ
jgi:hypothetical protein